MTTIKKILFCLAVIVISHYSFSQSKFGIETGLNLSNARVNSMYGDENVNNRTGMLLGCFFEFNTSKHFSIQPGFRYIQRGNVSDNGVTKLIQKVNYVEFPLTCNVIINFNKFKPFLAAGFYFGYYVSANQTQTYGSGEYYECDVSDFYKSSDVGYVLGCGLNYELSKRFDVFMSFYYTGGVKNVLEDEAIGSVSNTGHQLSAGMKVRL